MDSLYHYTTIEALNSMIRDTDIILWATRFDYLNDKSEFNHGVDLISKCLIEFEDNAKIPQAERLSLYIESEGEDLKKFHSDREIGFYVISLSEESNSLPMWNTYSNNSNGIAIGLDYNLTNKRINDFSSIRPLPPYLNRFSKIKYSKAEVFKIIEAEYHLLKAPSNNERLWNYISFLNQVAIFIKDKCFEYENEWRIIIKDEDYGVVGNKNPTKGVTFPTQFRVKNGMLVPYKEISIPIEALTQILVGPTHNFEQSQKSLKMFLSNKGIDDSKVEIKMSNLPFRK